MVQVDDGGFSFFVFLLSISLDFFSLIYSYITRCSLIKSILLGLLLFLRSMPAVEYSKSFITSVVVGKDVVPRIGLHQMEALRADLINAIQRSVDPKWKTIACSMICCCCGPQPTSVVEMSSHDAHVNVYEQVQVSFFFFLCFESFQTKCSN